MGLLQLLAANTTLVIQRLSTVRCEVLLVPPGPVEAEVAGVLDGVPEAVHPRVVRRHGLVLAHLPPSLQTVSGGYIFSLFLAAKAAL